MSGIEGLSGRLLQVRRNVQKSQHAMDRLLQLGPNAWQRYENGSQVPGGKVLAKIAAIGIDTHWLLTGEGQMLIERPATVTIDMRPPPVALAGRLLTDAAHRNLVLHVLGLCGGMTPQQIRKVLSDAESCIDFFCPFDSTSQRFLSAIFTASDEAAREREAPQA